MSGRKGIDKALEHAQQQVPEKQKQRVDSLNKRYEALADKGLVERPSYNLASLCPLPKCLLG